PPTAARRCAFRRSPPGRAWRAPPAPTWERQRATPPRPRAMSRRERPVEDDIDLLEVMLDGEAGIDLGRRERPRHLGIGFERRLEVRPLLPNLHGVPLHQDVSLLAR